MTKDEKKQPKQVDRKTTIIVLIIAGILVWWAASDGSSKSTTKRSNLSEEGKQIVWIEKSKDAIRYRLKDPSSAVFRNVFFSRSGGVPTACGSVNSKNSLGGYSGHQRFIAAGDNTSLVFFEREVSDFQAAWNKFCRP